MDRGLLIEYLKCELEEAQAILQGLGLVEKGRWDYPTVAFEGKRLRYLTRLRREMDLQRGARAHQRLELARELIKIAKISDEEMT